MENENNPERFPLVTAGDILDEMDQVARKDGPAVAASTVRIWSGRLRVAIEDERSRWREAIDSAKRENADTSSPALATMREMLDMLDHVKELLQGPGSYPASVCKLRDDIAAAASKIASAEASRIVGEEVRT